MTLITDIKTRDWALSIAQQGEVVEQLSDINQCIYIILTTVKGTDPLRPTFGSGIHTYVDRPVTVALPNIVREATKAIEKWESRVSITKITPKLVDGSSISIKVEWRTVTSNLVGTTTVTYNR